MSFNLLGLITDGSCQLNIEKLSEQLSSFFKETENFSIEYEDDPFEEESQNLLLRWGDWWIRVFFESGELVAQSSCEIAEILPPNSVEGLSGVDKRVRVLFADDEQREFTNEILYMMVFLETIPGTIIYDPQKNELLD
ncbi:hypothetical protein K6Y31_16440 [Motilimonas cestriensis]|uniref:Uncharacterized protein n=1 Tax=Motilimonas cestriensis TaxID=2742685 RepID=A0ABS8WDK3_9GAMM|nr:hypothetical protein [Motilimonas cestriensis]MCE2596387.1 hypothetical protein [Motilimonas cestriensis]